MIFRNAPKSSGYCANSGKTQLFLVLLGFLIGQLPWWWSAPDVDCAGPGTSRPGDSTRSNQQVAASVRASPSECLPPMFPDRKLGIVWHVVEKDHAKVPKRFSDWRTFIPCNLSCGYPRPDLVFWFNRRLDDHPAIADALKSYVDAMDPAVRACFDQVLFLSAGLTESEDTYVKNEWHEGVKINSSIPLTQGPNLMFQRMLDSPELRARYEYVFALDAEVAPLRSFWLDKVFLESNTPAKFWMKGSVQRMSHEYFAAKSFPLMIEKRFHLNGNALYRLDDDFSALVKRLRATRGEYPYDYLLQDYLTNATEWVNVQEVLHYFVYADFIQNRKSDPRLNRQRRADFLARYPNTFLEHR
eukprot:TRINITY_DN10767_c0_g1_i3.p2 TRINITY_DN10767_c0_g1~~TRINITY_DN10767_c0_g1_i3.p2  ORF type:complete len:357 (-),score=72.82 TRINITY_DN10767_c0_g1_i3:279-1349(-)